MGRNFQTISRKNLKGSFWKWSLDYLLSSFLKSFWWASKVKSKWRCVLFAVKVNLLWKIKVKSRCFVLQYLSGTLPLSHGFEASVPVQQLENGHQLLQSHKIEENVKFSKGTERNYLIRYGFIVLVDLFKVFRFCVDIINMSNNWTKWW